MAFLTGCYLLWAEYLNELKRELSFSFKETNKTAKQLELHNLNILLFYTRPKEKLL